MAGMTLAIEPMVNAGTWEVACEDDDWTIVTDDGSLSAHYENTILVTKDGCEILTLRQVIMMKNKTLSDRYPKGQAGKIQTGKRPEQTYIVTASDDQFSMWQTV